MNQASAWDAHSLWISSAASLAHLSPPWLSLWPSVSSAASSALLRSSEAKRGGGPRSCSQISNPSPTMRERYSRPRKGDIHSYSPQPRRVRRLLRAGLEQRSQQLLVHLPGRRFVRAALSARAQETKKQLRARFERTQRTAGWQRQWPPASPAGGRSQSEHCVPREACDAPSASVQGTHGAQRKPRIPASHMRTCPGSWLRSKQRPPDTATFSH